MRLRDMQKDDVPVCAKMRAKIFSTPPWKESPDEAKSLKEFSEYFDRLGRQAKVAVEGSAIVGYWIGSVESYGDGDDTPYFFLQDMAVIPEKRGQDIGKMLLEDAEACARYHKCDQVTLATAAEVPAYAFYRHMQYDETDRQGHVASMSKVIPVVAIGAERDSLSRD